MVCPVLCLVHVIDCAGGLRLISTCGHPLTRLVPASCRPPSARMGRARMLQQRAPARPLQAQRRAPPSQSPRLRHLLGRQAAQRCATTPLCRVTHQACQADLQMQRTPSCLKCQQILSNAPPGGKAPGFRLLCRVSGTARWLCCDVSRAGARTQAPAAQPADADVEMADAAAAAPPPAAAEAAAPPSEFAGQPTGVLRCTCILQSMHVETLW